MPDGSRTMTPCFVNSAASAAATSFGRRSPASWNTAIFTGDRVGRAAMQRRERFDDRGLQPIPVFRRKPEHARKSSARAGWTSPVMSCRRFPRRQIAILREPRSDSNRAARLRTRSENADAVSSFSIAAR